MEAITVYWTTGCSSCVRVKEFLTGKGVPYESVNVATNPAAMKFLASLGIRSIPVVVRDQEYTFAQSLDDVARFVGIDHAAEYLPPEVLVSRWKQILQIASDTISNIPAPMLEMLPAPPRARTVRDVAYHIFQVPDAFLQVAIDGLEDWTVVANIDAPPTIDLAGILAYAEDMNPGSTCPSATASAWPRPASSPQWAQRATATTTPWPRPSTGSTKSRSSTGAGLGRPSKRWNWRRWNGWPGSTTTD